MKKNKVLNLIWPVLGVLFLIAVWSIVAKAIDSEYVLPSVGKTVKEFGGLFLSGDFYKSFLMTLLRSVLAFSLSFLLAVLLGTVSVKNKNFGEFLSPIIGIIRALPTISVVLLLLVWTNKFFAPVIVTMLVVFPILFNNVKSALDSVDKSQVEMCRLFNVSEKEIFKKVYIPQIMPYMYSSIGSGLSLNIKLMVAGEVLSSTAFSLGGMLNNANSNLEISKMLAIVMATVACGLIIESVFNKLYKRSVKHL